MFCRIRLKDTNYQEYHNYRILDGSSFNRCLEIYKQYVTYKKFKDIVPIFVEEFELPHSDVIGYYDGNELVAFTLAYRFKSANSVWADQFAWDYKNKKLGLGHIANKNEIALYKRLGFDYFYLGESSDYKAKLDGYEISNFFDTWQTT
tara:strand:- start:172 stop:615 length:444 start_codon:yes stop_codon:yes gene_type:complete